MGEVDLILRRLPPLLSMAEAAPPIRILDVRSTDRPSNSMFITRLTSKRQFMHSPSTTTVERGLGKLHIISEFSYRRYPSE